MKDAGDVPGCIEGPGDRPDASGYRAVPLHGEGGDGMQGHGNFVDVSLDAPDHEVVERAVSALSSGQAIVFPTDTVYGIGVAVMDVMSPDLLFEIKDRDRSKAIPWLASGIDCLEAYGRDVSGYCLALAGRFWPGPLTLVVDAGERVPHAFQGAGQTIALRVPKSPVAFAIMRELGSPLATTSANVSGRDAVNDSALLDGRIVSMVPMVLDGGLIEGGKPSTIVDCTGAVPRVLREGAVSAEQVMEAAR